MTILRYFASDTMNLVQIAPGDGNSTKCTFWDLSHKGPISTADALEVLNLCAALPGLWVPGQHNLTGEHRLICTLYI